MRPENTKREIHIEALQTKVVVQLGGTWKLDEPLPDWSTLLSLDTTREVEVRLAPETQWDSSLPLFLIAGREWCAGHGITLRTDSIPRSLKAVMEEVPSETMATLPDHAKHAESDETGSSPRVLRTLYTSPLKLLEHHRETNRFLELFGNTLISLAVALRRPRRFRWRNCLSEMLQCGPQALPIVGLLSFLIGGTLSFQGAIQLEQLGADIYVVDLVSLAVIREVGPLITAVVLAGRTGAAFAAEIANMKVQGEIDALETLGISSMEFLVLPRLVALALMMPLMTLYADCLGMMGGLAVALSTVDISAMEFWVKAQALLGLNDLGLGLVKSVVFAFVVGFAGCLRGLQSERTSAGVGAAATSAVVTGILLIVVSDAIFSPIAKILGI